MMIKKKRITAALLALGLGAVTMFSREFDSWISEKVPAGRIKPAFFVSNFLFLSIVFYCNVL